MWPRVEYQSPDAPVGIEDRHRIVRLNSELQADSTKGVVSVDEDVSESNRRGEADDTNPSMLSRAEALDQGRDRILSELARNQIQSSVGTYGVADHVTHHRRSRRLGVVDEVTQNISDPPAAAPGRRLAFLGGECLKCIGHSAAIFSDTRHHGLPFRQSRQ
jgi:hypothetical protein